MYKNEKVSVIFPSYNEEKNIVEAINDFFSTGVVDEIIVVNNNSTDRTVERAKETNAILVNEHRQGYGYALRKGLKAASGGYIITAEPDGTFRGNDIFKLLAYVEEFDMVCGTRTTKELIWSAANMGWFLRFGNIVVAKMLEFLFQGPSLSDCGCTLRLIRRDSLNKFSTKLSVGGSYFLPEMMILALVNNLRVIEIPVNYHARKGLSKITGSLKGTLKTGLNMIWLILRYRVRYLI
jgi:glycosyltransferase involved in cell wall biosynthesis